MKASQKITPTVAVSYATPMVPRRGVAPVTVRGVLASTRIMVEMHKRIEVVGSLSMLGALTAAAPPQCLYPHKKKYYRKRGLEEVSHSDASIAIRTG